MQPGSVEVRIVAAGGWWDAVRVPLDLGADALRHLGDETGAVIADGFSGRLYWLIPPGSAAGWELPRVRVLGRGRHVAIPPLHRVSAFMGESLSARHLGVPGLGCCEA
ncbi:hypothetical protein [Streptomyces sp. NPDC006334]|uniref:hypothetical protein n=1 Tax=Streptomyces sp. NPDC006334 TaxID=3156754 RepID=UPI0033A1C40F